MIGNYLDMVPDWIWFYIFTPLAVLYYVQILVGIFVMSDHLKYPEIPIVEFEKMIALPFYLYYVLFFTKKLNDDNTRTNKRRHGSSHERKER